MDTSKRIKYKRINRKEIKRDLHRIVMENYLGRKLCRYEVVHHINGNGLDNRIENLQLMSLSEHSRMHMIGYVATEETRAKISKAQKIVHPKKKFFIPQIWEAISLLGNGESQRNVAKKFGVCPKSLMLSTILEVAKLVAYLNFIKGRTSHV